MSIFYASLTSVFDYYGFVVCSEIKKCDFQLCSSFLCLFLAIWDPLKFHMNLRMGFSTSVSKNTAEIFM